MNTRDFSDEGTLRGATAARFAAIRDEQFTRGEIDVWWGSLRGALHLVAKVIAQHETRVNSNILELTHE